MTDAQRNDFNHKETETKKIKLGTHDYIDQFLSFEANDSSNQ